MTNTLLFAALFLLDALAVWCLISARGWWGLKLLALLLAATVNFGVVDAFKYGDGWATGSPRGQGQMLDCYAVEPDQGTAAVYVWAVPQKVEHGLIGYQSKSLAPRAYQLPYSQQLDKQCNRAKKSAGQGVPVEIGPLPKDSSSLSRSTGFRFYQLPPSLLTPKH